MTETTSTSTLPAKQEPIPNALFTREEIAQFKKLVYSEYGITLTDKQSYLHASALLIIVGTILEIYFAFRWLIDANTKQ